MPVKGIERVKRNYRVAIGKIDGERTEGAVYAVLSQVGAMANTMVPIDSSTLINSQYAPQIDHRSGKTEGQIGYTARYAAAVHDAPGTLKGQPRADFGRTSNRSEVGPQRPRAFGGGTGVGNYWDPNAEPRFLEKGGEQIAAAVPAILKHHYKA